jgi:phosphomevalonate kinase
LIRVECSEEVRIQRGFVFTPNIDDQDTECALDSFNEWDKRIHNDGDLFILDSQLNEIIDLYSI